MALKEIRMIGNGSTIDRLLNTTNTIGNSFYEIGEENICMTMCYKKWAERIYKFEVRKDDTYVVGFPRSGTTWCQEMIWLIVNDLDFEGAKERLTKRAPTLLTDAVMDLNVTGGQDGLTYIDGLKSPRIIRSHLHWSLLPDDITKASKQPKIIFILRNPKDVCVSYYYLSLLTDIYKGTFEEFCELFLAGRVIYAPFWKYVLSFWKERHRSNILFIKYKDMTCDLRSVIAEVSAFLGKQLREEQAEQLVEHLRFENMKKNRAVNPEDTIGHIPITPDQEKSTKYGFIRAGMHNGYGTIMSPELIVRFDVWAKEQLQGTGLIVD